MAERPTKRTAEVEQRIIDGLCDGLPLVQLCQQEGMLTRRAVYDWIRADPDFAAQVEHARNLGYEALAEDALHIADNTRAIGDHVQLAKMRIDTRLRLLASWHPKRYGQKQSLEHSGVDGKPIEVAHADVGQLARNLRAIASGQAEPVPIEAQPAKLLGSDLL